VYSHVDYHFEATASVFYVLLFPIMRFMYFDTLRGCVLSNVYLYFITLRAKLRSVL